MINNIELLKQISFYLSDQNLQNDEFFYKQIQNDKQHYVPIDSFLKCNKVKKLGATKREHIIQAIKESQDLQLNKDQTKLKRKDMQDLPEFKPKKKLKSDNVVEQQPNPFDKFESQIFTIAVEKDEKVSFKFIKQGLLKNYGVYAPYVRYNKNQGNFAIDKKLCTPQLVEKMAKGGLTIGQVTLNLSKTTGEKLNEFWQKHGHHYNGIIEDLRRDQTKKLKQKKRNAIKNRKINQFEFCGEKYDDINKLKSLFKNIVCRNPNKVPLKETETKYVKELLSYHDKAEEKLKDLKHFIVDVNPNYPDTRCLYVVRNDDSKEDFSVLKCIHNIQAKYAE